MENTDFFLINDKKVCRLCGEKNENCERLFTNHSDQYAMAKDICSYIGVELYDNGLYPCGICPGCNLNCEMTAKFLTRLRDGQNKIKQIYGEYDPKCSIEKKRGRKRNLEMPDVNMEYPNATEMPEEQQIGDISSTKRCRRSPVRYKSMLVGKGLTKFYTENLKLNPKKNDIKDVALIESELIAQMRTADGEVGGDVINVFSNASRCTTRFVCTFCNEVFYRKSLFLAHVANHKKVQYECTACNEVFSHKVHFEQHQIITKHNGMGIIEELNKTEAEKENSKAESPTINIIIGEKCQITSIETLPTNEFGSQDNVVDNILDSSNQVCSEPTINDTEEVFQSSELHCIKCGKSFESASAVKRHQLVHSLERPFKCLICSASFKVKQNFDTHMSAHSNQKSYACDKCPAKFVLQHNLEAHKKIHTGEKPFKCSFCNKAFNVRHNLTQHEKKHTDQQPFKCNACFQTFKTAKQRRRHVAIEHRIPAEFPTTTSLLLPPTINSDELKILKHRHLCKECGKLFHQKSALNKHYRTHTGERPYWCEICPRQFSDPSNFKKHKNSHLHGKMSPSMIELRNMMEDQGIEISDTADPDGMLPTDNIWHKTYDLQERSSSLCSENNIDVGTMCSLEHHFNKLD